MKRPLIALVSLSLLSVALPAAAEEAAECVVTATAPASAVVNDSAAAEGTALNCSDEALVLQVEEGSAWTDVESATAAAETGAFTVPLTHKADEAGVQTYRVVATGAAGETVASPEFDLTRTGYVNAYNAGSKLVGEGTNAWGTVVGATGKKVWTEAKVGASWSTSQISTTSSTGSFVLPLTYGINSIGDAQFRVAAETGAGTVYSEPFTITRVANVSAHSAGQRQVGAVSNAWGTVSGGANSAVWTQVRTASGWSRSQSTTTNAQGGYLLPLSYGINTVGTYEYRVAASVGGTTIYSKPFTFKRTGTVSAASAGQQPVGVTTNVWGTAAGSPGRTVWTEVKIGTNWSRSAVGKTNSNGTYALPLTYGSSTAGTYQFRVGVSTALGTVYSAPFSFTRTAPLVSQGFRADSRCMTGRVFCASKSQRKMAWMIDGKIIEVMDARFGRAGYETRNGKNKIYWKHDDHVSSLYGSEMPYSMFFDGGQAIHYSENFRRVGYSWGSAGCINLRDLSLAKRMFETARVGDWVVVYD